MLLNKLFKEKKHTHTHTHGNHLWGLLISL